MQKKIKFIVAIISIFSMVGCSLFGGHNQIITVVSDPPEADIYLEDTVAEDITAMMNRTYGNKQLIGVYFWIMSIGRNKYNFYVGQSRVFRKRTKQYAADYQPASSDDIKINHMQQIILADIPEAKFSLFFKECELIKSKAEKQYIKDYNCIINNMKKANKSVIDELEQAYLKYNKHRLKKTIFSK